MTMWKRLGACVLGGLLAACGSDGGPGQDGSPGQDGKNSLVRAVAEPPGANCQHGGTALQSGLDANGNGALENSEVTSTAYTCNGASGNSGGNGAQVLVRLDPEPAGTNCAQGGTQVNSGVDTSGNGTLEAGEVTSTAYVCNGADGTNGSQGTPGTKSLVRLDPEPAGTHCAQGGTAVHSGLDANGNNTLDTAEITQTQYVCSGPSGYPTGWAASSPANGTGDVPIGVWLPSGKKVSIFKTSASSQLKVTVSDNLGAGTGTNHGNGYYAVRVNGSAAPFACVMGQYVSNTSGWANTYFFPFATVCLTEAWPAGLYEFETWVFANVGSARVAYGSSQSVVLVEELHSTARYGFSGQGEPSSTTSSTFQQASGRTVTYTKQAADTLLKVTLADTFRGALNQNDGWGTVMVRMDGNDTICYTGKYDAQGTGGNFHDPFVMTCVLPGVAPGPHTFSVWIRSGSGGDTFLGWERSYPLLMVEEIASQALTYIGGSNLSDEIGGNWAEVGTRQLQHNVSAVGKTVRVTYSDTFRSAANCNAQWGFYQLYVDNEPTGCLNGQYAYNTGSTNQNHHRPVNHVCLVRNLSPGRHTFSIWSSTRHAWDGTVCGSNHFGWNRGQNLLMVEELP